MSPPGFDGDFDSSGAAFGLGDPSECHENVAALRRAGRGDICTGFALPEDGYWLLHSWLVEPSGRVIETTEERTAYYGHRFDDEGAKLFAGT
jgi:hypothetical protein